MLVRIGEKIREDDDGNCAAAAAADDDMEDLTCVNYSKEYPFRALRIISEISFQTSELLNRGINRYKINFVLVAQLIMKMCTCIQNEISPIQLCNQGFYPRFLVRRIYIRISCHFFFSEFKRGKRPDRVVMSFDCLRNTGN